MAPTCWDWPSRWRRTCPTPCSAPPTRRIAAPAIPMATSGSRSPRMDGSSPVDSAAAFARARADLHAYLDRVLADEHLPASRLALVGFSQGTMMALHVAPEREAQIACVVGFSGRIVDAGLLAEPASRPPVLLIHGDMDEVVPFPAMAACHRAAGRCRVRDLWPCDEGHRPWHRPRRAGRGAAVPAGPPAEALSPLPPAAAGEDHPG